jgi:hypothetical protein
MSRWGTLNFVAAVVAVLAGLYLKIATGGWLVLILGPVYLAAAALHLLVHWRVSRMDDAFLGRSVALLAISHVAVAGAYLLQWDTGDSYAWLTVTAMMNGAGHWAARPPSWVPVQENGLGYDLWLFIPVVAADVALLATSFARANKTAR